MAAKIDQKAYLQKYLSGPSGEKKKKKKKVAKGNGFKIIDDDLDLSKLRPLDGDELDILGEGEDAPQIAGIIDERPEEVRKLEQFKTTSKWRVINEDDGFNSKLQIEEIKKDVKEIEKENELIFGKMYSDSEDEQQNKSNLPPPPKQQPNDKQMKHGSTKKPQTHSDSDFSPPRKTKEGEQTNCSGKNDDSELTPPRKSDKRKLESRFKEKKRGSDSDLSPPRKHEKRKVDFKSREKKHNSDSDLSPPRKREKPKIDSKSREKKHNSDSDLSPPRKRDKPKVDSKSREKKHTSDSDLSPPRKRDKPKVDSRSREKKHNSDSDLSPPRTKTKTKERNKKASRWGDFKEEEERYKRCLENSLPQRSSRSPDSRSLKDKQKTASNSSISQKCREHSKAYDSDLSPPRKSDKTSNRNYDSDLSPPRKSTKYNKSPERGLSKHDTKNRYDERNNKNKSDKYSGNKEKKDNPYRSSKEQSSDRKIWDSDKSPTRNDRNRMNNKRKYNRSSDSPPPSNKKMEKTLDGKQAGLQDAMQLRQENEAFRRREEDAFNKMTDEVSGRNARVVSRKGKRETSEERQKQKEKADKQKELDEKYKKWGKGLKQLEDQERRVQDYMHEAAKPLARHKGDKDLEDRLKDVEREGDPMLQYIRGKKRERGELGPEKPSYKGSFPPNRFNITPGYRWDGVDRSNGYEKKYFDQQSKRKAQAEEAYKWSTEDL